MRTILVDVDTQHDFCDPSGALFVKGAEKLAGAFKSLVDRAVARGVKIVGSVDSHAFDAWEFAGARETGPNGEAPGFPPHCVKGTRGWLKVPGTMAERTRFVPNVKTDVAPFVDRHDPQMILLEKEVYSLFANPNAPEVLKKLMGEEKARFYVFGVATDYCVKAAALGLVEWGEVCLVRDAIAAVDPANGEKAIAECAAKGVRMVSTEEALSAL
jgi:nicotinamidase/pyrazinamidase